MDSTVESCLFSVAEKLAIIIAPNINYRTFALMGKNYLHRGKRYSTCVSTAIYELAIYKWSQSTPTSN